jgi:CO dehydrogenase nickel-insertion accessory protein CooC1
MKSQLTQLFTPLAHDNSPSLRSSFGCANAHCLFENNSSKKSRYEKAKRLKARWANGKIRVNEIPQEAIEEMKDLRFIVGLSYESIAKLYELSRYMVVSAVERRGSNQQEDINKSIIH